MKTPEELRKLADELDEKKHQEIEVDKIRKEKEKKIRDDIATKKAIELVPIVINELEMAISQGKLENIFNKRIFKYIPQHTLNPKFEPEHGWDIELSCIETFSIKLAEELKKLGFEAKSMNTGTSNPPRYCVCISI